MQQGNSQSTVTDSTTVSLREELASTLISASNNNIEVTDEHDITTNNTAVPTESMEDEDDDEGLIQELRHLHKRIHNVQESIRLSSAALCSPTKWELNCLSAVKNCIHEWTAIVSYHCRRQDEHHHTLSVDRVTADNDSNSNSNMTTLSTSSSSSLHIMHPESEWSRTTSLKIFTLLQLSMQCGPLTGSNAGYFKRCGSNVARLAYHFLIDAVVVMDGDGDGDGDDNVNGDYEENEDGDTGVDIGIEDDSTVDEKEQQNDNHNRHNNNNNNRYRIDHNLRFTERQEQIITKWIIAAEKATNANKPPSKSALKLQQEKSKKQKTKEMKQNRAGSRHSKTKQKKKQKNKNG